MPDRSRQGRLTAPPPAADALARDVSDVERGAVVRRLERALHEGRITVTEFDERACVVHAVGTRGELDELVHGQRGLVRALDLAHPVGELRSVGRPDEHGASDSEVDQVVERPGAMYSIIDAPGQHG